MTCPPTGSPSPAPAHDRPEQPATPQDPPLILSVGILHPRKGMMS